MDHIYTHGKASISDILKEVQPSPSSRWTAPVGLAAMISVAVALALPLGEKIQGLAAANAAATQPAATQPATRPATGPATQPAGPWIGDGIFWAKYYGELVKLYNDLAAGADRKALLDEARAALAKLPKGDEEDGQQRKLIEELIAGLEPAIADQQKLASLPQGSIERLVTGLIDSTRPSHFWIAGELFYSSDGRWGQGEKELPQDVFDGILALGDKAIPQLVEHLDDKASSRAFLRTWGMMEFPGSPPHLMKVNELALCLIERISGCYFERTADPAVCKKHVAQWWSQVGSKPKIERLKWQFPHVPRILMEFMFKELLALDQRDFLKAQLLRRYEAAKKYRYPEIECELLAQLGEYVALDLSADDLKGCAWGNGWTNYLFYLFQYGGPKQYQLIAQSVKARSKKTPYESYYPAQVLLTASEEKGPHAWIVLEAFLGLTNEIAGQEDSGWHRPADLQGIRYCDAGMYELAKRGRAAHFDLSWPVARRDAAIKAYLEAASTQPAASTRSAGSGQANSGQATRPAAQAPATKLAPSATRGVAQATRLPGSTISIKDAADRASGVYVAEVLRATKGHSAYPTTPTADYECFFTMRETLRGITMSGDCGWNVVVQTILHDEQPPEVGRQYVMFVIYDKARKLLPATPEQIDLTRRALAAPAPTAASGSPTTQAERKPKLLPGSGMSDAVAAGVARAANGGPIVATAQTDPQPEELGNGVLATVQRFGIVRLDGVQYYNPDESCDFVYCWQADHESPIPKGQTVIWFLGFGRGMKACADTPANRKLAVAAYNATPERGLTEFKFDPRLLPNSKMTLDKAVWGSAVGIWTKQEALVAVVLEATEENVMEFVWRVGHPDRTEKCKVVKTLFGPAIGLEVKLRYERFDPQERPMSKGERFIWIAMAHLGQPGQLEGIRALVDTPANRALVVSAGKAAGIAPAPATAPAPSTRSGSATQAAAPFVKEQAEVQAAGDKASRLIEVLRGDGDQDQKAKAAAQALSLAKELRNLRHTHLAAERAQLARRCAEAAEAVLTAVYEAVPSDPSAAEAIFLLSVLAEDCRQWQECIGWCNVLLKEYPGAKIPGVVSDRHQFNTYRRLGDSQAVLDQRPAASESLLRSLLHADEPRYHISGWIRLLENDPRLAISAVMGKAMPELQAQLNRQMQAAELRVRLTFVPPVPAPAPGALGTSAVKDDVLVTVEYPDYRRTRIDTLRDFSIVVHAIAAATKLVSNTDGPSFYSGPIWTSEPLTLSSEQSLSRRFSIPRDRIPNDQPVALLAELTYAKRPREGLAEQWKEWKQFYWTQPLLLSSGAPAEAATATAPSTRSGQARSTSSGQAPSTSSGQATQPVALDEKAARALAARLANEAFASQTFKQPNGKPVGKIEIAPESFNDVSRKVGRWVLRMVRSAGPEAFVDFAADGSDPKVVVNFAWD